MSLMALGERFGKTGPYMWCVPGWTPRRSEQRWKGIRKQDHDCVCDWESFSNARGFMESFSPWSNWEYIVMSQVSPRWSHSSSLIPVASCATFVSDAYLCGYSTFGSPLQQNHCCRFIFLTTAWPLIHSSQIFKALKNSMAQHCYLPETPFQVLVLLCCNRPVGDLGVGRITHISKSLRYGNKGTQFLTALLGIHNRFL